MRENQILKIYGTGFKEMTKALLERADLAARIPGLEARIGIKPNLVVPSPAEFGATTHPEIVAAIIEYLQEHGFENICITEGSWIGDKTADAYEYCGYREISEKYAVPFIDAQKSKAHKVDCDGVELNICDIVDEIDFMINVPVLKGHCQTKITCALKNMKGLIPNSEKRRFHTMGLHKPIAHLSRGIHQDFIVVDHICGDLDFEEGGNPVVKNCIMAALDPVLVDSYTCYLLHYSPDDVPYIRMAEKLGSGSTDLRNAEIISINMEKCLSRDKLAETKIKKDAQNCEAAWDAVKASACSESAMAHVRYKCEEKSGNILSMDEELPQERKILQVAYAVDEVDSCSACYGNLIPALYRLKEEGLLDRLKERIAIGQGHRGEKGTLGIGRCTAGYEHCIMGCPPDEEKIYEELREYILEHTLQKPVS